MGRGYAWLDTGTHQDCTKQVVLSDLFRNAMSLQIACLGGNRF